MLLRENDMKSASTSPLTTPTYDFFRRQVRRLISETKVKNPSEAELRAVMAAAVEEWRGRGFAKSWIVRAKAEALREIAGVIPNTGTAPPRQAFTTGDLASVSTPLPEVLPPAKAAPIQPPG
jgi:hypothetical protein